MTKEQLLAAGVPEDKIDGILKIYKESIDGNYIPKATFEVERTKVKDLNTEIANRDTQISELGKFKGTAEDLQIKVTKLEQDNKDAKTKYDEELTRVVNTNGLLGALKDVVIDPDDIISRLDLEKITFKDGVPTSGLDDQINAFKESKPHYFPTATTTKESKPQGWVFGKTPSEGSDTGAVVSKDADFGKQLAENKRSGTDVAAKAQDHYFK